MWTPLSQKVSFMRSDYSGHDQYETRIMCLSSVEIMLSAEVEHWKWSISSKKYLHVMKFGFFNLVQSISDNPWIKGASNPLGIRKLMSKSKFKAMMIFFNIWEVIYIDWVDPDGPVVIILATGPEVCRFKPSRGRWIFSERKTAEYDFLQKGSKAVCPIS